MKKITKRVGSLVYLLLTSYKAKKELVAQIQSLDEQIDHARSVKKRIADDTIEGLRRSNLWFELECELMRDRNELFEKSIA